MRSQITDDTRIVGAIPTIKHLKKVAKVVLCSHLGRPGGQKDDKFSLNVAARLSELMSDEVVCSRLHW